MNISSMIKRFISPVKKGTPLVATLVIIMALAVGISAKIVTKKNDSAIEQVAEKVLSEYGIDYDFSPEDEADAAPKE